MGRGLTVKDKHFRDLRWTRNGLMTVAHMASDGERELRHRPTPKKRRLLVGVDVMRALRDDASERGVKWRDNWREASIDYLMHAGLIDG